MDAKNCSFHVESSRAREGRRLFSVEVRRKEPSKLESRQLG